MIWTFFHRILKPIWIFFSCEIDDATLSQVCETMEKEHECMNGIDGLSLTQALDFGDFEISNIVAETDITSRRKLKMTPVGNVLQTPYLMRR